VEHEQPNYRAQPTPTITTTKVVKTVNKDITIFTWKTLTVRVKKPWIVQTNQELHYYQIMSTTDIFLISLGTNKATIITTMVKLITG
jgi:hypothetical protein